MSKLAARSRRPVRAAGAQYTTNSRLARAKLARICEAAKLLEEKGKLSPSGLVEYARPKSSPIHRDFPWDDREAAELYRQEVASYYIRAIRIVIEQPNGGSLEGRAFLPVPLRLSDTPSEGTEYISVERASENRPLMEYHIEQAVQDLHAWRAKWDFLRKMAREWPGLKAVFAAADKVPRERKKKARKRK